MSHQAGAPGPRRETRALEGRPPKVHTIWGKLGHSALTTFTKRRGITAMWLRLSSVCNNNLLKLLGKDRNLFLFQFGWEKKENSQARHRWPIPVIPATWQAEIRGSYFKATLGKKFTRLHPYKYLALWCMPVMPPMGKIVVPGQSR
jgi:hypothetical protein